jgi:hypothetical protein
MTEVDSCGAIMDTFETLYETCMDLAISDETGAAACNCFSNSSFTSMITELKGCNLASDMKDMVNAGKMCKQEYGKCRKYQEAIIGTVSACGQSTNKLKEKAKALTENADNVGKALDAISDLTAGRRRFNSREKREETNPTFKIPPPTDCAGMITVSTVMITIVKQDKTSPKVSIYAKLVVAAVSITCDTDEVASLM